jgi:hypothetical protein
MRPMSAARLLTLWMLATAQPRAEQPTPFCTLFRAADAAIIATAETAKRLPQSDPRAAAQPVDAVQYAAVHLCEITAHVEAIVKDRPTLSRHGAEIRFTTYLPSAACAPEYLGRPNVLGRPVLWLLRTEGGELRTLKDNPSTFFVVGSLTAATRQELARWRRPELAVMYLFLKPGVIIPQEGYATSSLPAQMFDVGGGSDFLRVYRAVYLESNERTREQINLAVASFGLCLNSARRAAQAAGRLDEFALTVPFLNAEVARRTEDVAVAQMSWATREQLLRDFDSPEAAVNELTMRACSSGISVKARARDLLSRYFGINPATLPCIPCD